MSIAFRTKILSRLIWLAVIAWIASAADGRAEFYRFVDEHGRREKAAAIERQRQLEEADTEARRNAQADEAARREAARQQEELLKRQETRVTVNGNQILVPVRLDHDGRTVEAQMLLDTGASSIVLHRQVAQRLNLVPSRKAEAQVVGGRSITTEIAELNQLIVRPVSASDIPVLIIAHDGAPVPFDGLLGMNFLRNVRYSVDYQNQVIRWLP
jgi:predicted aspartyl protease